MTDLFNFVMHNADSMRNLAEALALTAAGIFFLYRFFLGYFFVNLSVSLEKDRWHKKGTSTDYISVKCTLTKGDRGTLTLHDARVRASWKTGYRIASLAEVERLGFKTERLGAIQRRLVNFGVRSRTAPLLSLTPGEITQYECLLEVPAETPCHVEVVVLGKTKWSPWVSQWRASIISKTAD